MNNEISELKECKIVRRDGMVGIITNDEAMLKWGGSSEVMVIPEEAYRYVQGFVRTAEPALDYLINDKPTPGTVTYWELNIHDKLVENLYNANCVHMKRDISNALWALGY